MKVVSLFLVILFQAYYIRFCVDGSIKGDVIRNQFKCCVSTGVCSRLWHGKYGEELKKLPLH